MFVCGGINPDNLSDYGEFNQVEYDKTDRLSRAERFLTLLGNTLVDNDFQIYTGFEYCILSAVFILFRGLCRSDEKKEAVFSQISGDTKKQYCSVDGYKR